MKKTLLILMNLLSGFHLFSENIVIPVDEILYDDLTLANSMNDYFNTAQSTFSKVSITSVKYAACQAMDPVGNMQNNSIRKIS
jgi:hypothetical protein